MNNRRFNMIVKGAIFVFLIAAVLGERLQKRDVKCTINMNDDPTTYQPLLLDFTNGKHDFLYPMPFGDGDLIVHRGDSFGIACPGSKMYPDTSGPFEYTLAMCDKGDEFLLDGPGFETPFKDISCGSVPSSMPRQITSPNDVKCVSGTPFEIGFELQSNKRFFRTIDLCFDMKMTNTLYAHAIISGSIGAAQKSVPSPSCFRNDKIFRRQKVGEAYTVKKQKVTLAAILKSTALADHYISVKGCYYFARGHLIAKTDFVYGAQQLATFYYANVVPMWQNINAGNWKTMEDNVRNLVALRGQDFEIWVGGHGILQLKDDKGIGQNIYLFKSGNELAIPVPKTLFKVVYNYATRTGIVLLTVNNPYLKVLTNQDRICTDVCGRIHYLTWKPTIASKGLSYCCEIDDFRKAYPNLPRFTTTHLLI